MNPHITVTPMAGIDPRLLVVGYPADRTEGRKISALHATMAYPIEDTRVNAAERDRQDALAFLHRLVMG